MYNIYVMPTGYITIRDAVAPANAINLCDVTALLHLRARINAYVDTLQPDVQPATPGGIPLLDPGMITTAEARDLAQQRGISIPITTLINAIRNRRVLGAIKSGPTWLMPRTAFIAWLDRYQPRAGLRAKVAPPAPLPISSASPLSPPQPRPYLNPHTPHREHPDQ